MASETGSPKLVIPSTEEPMNAHASAALDWRWLVRWVLLTTAAIPVAFVLTSPLAVIGLSIQRLAFNSGIVGRDSNSYLMLFGFLAAIALAQASAQWYLLRNYLPRPRDWFLATAGGLFTGGLAIGTMLIMISSTGAMPARAWSLAIILVGLGLGLAQWLVLRRSVPNAFWIILVDGLALGSILLSGESITSLPELLVLVLMPGTITGLGMWLLLRSSKPIPLNTTALQARPKLNRRRFLIIGMILTALVPLFFACSWAYASSQLTLAKNGGIYATAEEAVISRNSQGWGGASVVKLENVHAGPNRHDGKQPHIWFGGAQVYLDRVPEGWDRTQYLSGSFYVHVRDGWVYMGEGAFPEFVGWVMELFNLEGTREWIQNE